MRGDDGQVNLQEQEAVVLSVPGAKPIKFTESNQPKFTVNLKEETTFNLVEIKDYTLLSKATDSSGDVGLNPSVLIISDEAFERLKQGEALASFDIYQIEDARNSNALSHRVHDEAQTDLSTDIQTLSALFMGYKRPRELHQMNRLNGNPLKVAQLESMRTADIERGD